MKCRTLLHDIVSQTHLSDQRQMATELVRGYSVREFY